MTGWRRSSPASSSSLPTSALYFAGLWRRGVARDLEATADEHGAFVLEGVPAGAWNVLAAAPDGRSGSTIVELDPGGERDVDLDLEPPATVRGSLSNRGGSVQGAKIRLRGATPLAGAQVDDTGAFNLEGLPAGPWSVEVEHNGSLVPIVEGPSTLVVESGRAEDLTLVVDTHSTELRGRVVDADAQPVADALVELRSGEREPILAISDDNGRVEVPTTSAARYRVDVTGPRGLGLAHVADLPADADTVWTLEQPADISGHVRVQGRPVRRFEVAPPGSGLIPVLFTDDQGAFALTDLQPGPAQLAVFAPQGVAYARLDLQPGTARDVELDLQPWARATGRVVDGDGVPVVDARIYVSSQFPRADGTPESKTDDDGRFEVEGIGPGRTTFEVRKDRAQLRLDTRVVEPGDVLEFGVLRLE